MKSIQEIDGYAAQNTAHVLCALRAYELAAQDGSAAQATEKAIEVYESLCHRRVSDRTVRNWLIVAQRHGGIEKTPQNAFGALRSCPHLKRPIRERLRQIQETADELSATVKREGCDAFLLADLESAEKEITECLHTVLDNRPQAHLASIRKAARRLETMPIHRLCQHVSATETESVLEELLARLKTMASRQHRKAA